MKSLLSVVVSSLLFIATTASADEASVKKAVEAFFDGTKVEEVRKLPQLGLYEVRIGNELVYTDEKVTYLFAGSLIDVAARKNLTQARERELSAIKFADLPLDLAIKTVRGKGRRVIATFEDPNCGYCKRFANELTKVDDITVYTFLLPILSPDSTEKARAVWCAADRSKSWNELMLKDVAPAAASASCKTPIERVKEIGTKLKINGTPTIFLADGQRIPGMVRAAQLEEMFKELAAKK